jgi:hypothetical protein
LVQRICSSKWARIGGRINARCDPLSYCDNAVEPPYLKMSTGFPGRDARLWNR